MYLPTLPCTLLLAALGLGPAATPAASPAGPLRQGPTPSSQPGPPPQTASPTQAAPFAAAAAWAEFTALLRTNYGYFSRPGVAGDTILAYFEPQALQTTSKEEFRDVLQLTAHNFADPHFIVGPLDAQDYNVVPTNSDLVARYRAGRFEIVDVRRDGDAEKQGVAPGATIDRIGGQTPQAAVEAVMGRRLAALSPVQVDAGLNIALAGLRKQPRPLTLTTGRARRQYTLRPPSEQTARAQAAPP